MSKGSIEVGFWLKLSFNILKKLMQTPKAIELVFVAEPGLVKTVSQKIQRRIVSRQRHRKWIFGLSAVSEIKPRRVGETVLCNVNHFRNERKRLHRARTEILHQQ